MSRIKKLLIVLTSLIAPTYFFEGTHAAPVIQSDVMPAEFQVSIVLQSPVLNGNIDGKVALEIPMAGYFFNTRPAKLKHRYRLVGPLSSSGCTHNFDRDVDLFFHGIRTGDALAIETSVRDPLRNLQVRCPGGGGGGSIVPPEPGLEGQFHFQFKDGHKQATPTFSQGGIRIVGHITLVLACAVSAPRSLPSVPVTTIPSSGIWPRLMRHHLNKAQITALRGRGWAYGLTRPAGPVRPKETLSKDQGPAKLRTGICHWVDHAKFEFASIETFIASEYTPGGPRSCNYWVVFNHEYRHYQELARIFRSGQQKLREEMDRTSFPTRGRPAFAVSRAAADQFLKTKIDKVLNYTHQHMLVENRNDPFDSLSVIHGEDIQRGLASCSNW